MKLLHHIWKRSLSVRLKRTVNYFFSCSVRLKRTVNSFFPWSVRLKRTANFRTVNSLFSLVRQDEIKKSIVASLGPLGLKKSGEFFPSLVFQAAITV